MKDIGGMLEEDKFNLTMSEEEILTLEGAIIVALRHYNPQEGKKQVKILEDICYVINKIVKLTKGQKGRELPYG